MMDNLECFALMLGGENQAACVSSAISSEEVVIVSNCWPQNIAVFGVAWLWRNSVKSSCTGVIGTLNHDPRGKPALMRWILISTLSPATIRRMDSEAVAAVTGEPERGARSQSNADYVAPG